ncbi:methyltransferase domain-containing protein [Alicyclobacillus sp.]|uniref:class I SAM-dependent methyltransferase n=1 Tax=Alicyclobacillus sp. TaxID=61169 RepID=UPI0025BD9C13|nr:methyltransferase domain-containing protein [Alicyclobacillus sp.]MCL6516682.1 methyltransferase domain-containing protein [Alicyclobacillus sp.]
MRRIQDPVDFFDMVGQTQWHRAIQRTLIHWMGVRDTQHLLDVGCAAGWFAMQVSPRCGWVTGIDISPEMVRRAELNAEDYRLDNVSFVVGDARDMPLPDAGFDWVTCIDLLHLIEEPERALREMLRVCRPGGQVILVNPTRQLNPWTAQAYCDRHNLVDFDRDSFLSWATACARRPVMDLDTLRRIAAACGGVVESSMLLTDGLAVVSRVIHSTMEVAVSDAAASLEPGE